MDIFNNIVGSRRKKIRTKKEPLKKHKKSNNEQLKKKGKHTIKKRRTDTGKKKKCNNVKNKKQRKTRNSQKKRRGYNHDLGKKSLNIINKNPSCEEKKSESTCGYCYREESVCICFNNACNTYDYFSRYNHQSNAEEQRNYWTSNCFDYDPSTGTWLL